MYFVLRVMEKHKKYYRKVLLKKLLVFHHLLFMTNLSLIKLTCPILWCIRNFIASNEVSIASQYRTSKFSK